MPPVAIPYGCATQFRVGFLPLFYGKLPFSPSKAPVKSEGLPRRASAPRNDIFLLWYFVTECAQRCSIIVWVGNEICRGLCPQTIIPQ